MSDQTVVLGDCRNVLQTLDACSVDAIVCDPPYELGFMGKGWDSAGVSFQPETWAHVLRVLKPGGHLLAFGGTRTYHRIAVAIEDAGFEIRDCLCWMYGSGFPKSRDVAKAIDERAGAEREVVGQQITGNARSGSAWRDGAAGGQRMVDVTESATDDARAWEGWGTALKPAFEPIVLARKPLEGTVAANVLEHGTGALNIDRCRVEGAKGDGNWKGRTESVGYEGGWDSTQERVEPETDDGVGRWPANVLLDEAAAAMLDEQTGILTSGEPGTMRLGENSGAAYGAESRPPGTPMTGYGDSGGASRFFYLAKATRAERNAGLDGFEEDASHNYEGANRNRPDRVGSDGVQRTGIRHPRANVHPTVKPINLMRWLIRLVTPPGGLVVDPFTGSGSTGCACAVDGVRFFGVEEDADYVPIADARIAWWALHGEDGFRLCSELEASARRRAAVEEAGQLDIFA